MKYVEMLLNNFLLFSRQEVPLENCGLVHVDGENKDTPDFTESNRSGKSTCVAKALEWVLYGVVSGAEGVPLLRGADVVLGANDGKPVGDCFVILRARVPVHGDVLIARYRDHKEHGNAVRVKLDGEWKSWVDPKDAQGFVERLVGHDHEGFRHAVSPGQGLVARWSRLAPQGRKEILEGIVKSGWIEDARQAAGKAAGVEEKACDVLRGRVTGAKDALARAERAAADAKAAGEQARAALHGEAEWLAATIAEGRTWIAGAEQAASTLQRQRDEAQTAQTAAMQADRSARETRVGADMAYRRAEQTRSEAQASVQDAANLSVAAPCVKCGQAVTELMRGQLVEYRRGLLAQAEGALKQAGEQLAAARAASDDAAVRARGADEALQLADSALRNHSVALSGAREKLAGYERQAADVERRRLTPTPDEGAQQGVVAEAQAALAALEQETATQTRIAAHDAELVRVFGGMRIEALRSSTDYLNAQITLHLRQLLGETASARVVFTPKPSGDYVPDIEITASGGKFAAGSGGEQDRIDAAIWLGFIGLERRSSGTSSNILVLDEPGGFVDDVGKRRLVDIFQGLVGDTVSSLFVVSHEPGFRTRIRRRWTVVREGGKSRIEGV